MMLAQRNMAVEGREKGAIILTFAMMLLFLIGFAGIAIDLGRLFIVRTELQTALDSCALAAAQELDGQSNSTTRARNAGLVAGNVNNVNLQSPTWDGHGKLTANDISFRDQDYAATVSDASARYVQCQHTQFGVKAWLLPLMTAFSGTAYPSTNSVLGTAVATRGHAQSVCPVPLAFRVLNNTPPNYGMVPPIKPGDWIPVLVDNGTLAPGQIGWANYNGANDQSANETSIELGENGTCGVGIGRATLPGTHGVQESMMTVWNARFGIYKNKDGPDVSHPDYSGYAYTTKNWSGSSAYGDYVIKRKNFASLDNDKSSLSEGWNIAFDGKIGHGFTSIATPGTGGTHAQFGYNRRVVLVPVVTAANQIIDFACMFMLAPLNDPAGKGKFENTNFEFLGFTGVAGTSPSPCTTNGLAGGAAGALVPVLVR
jgi:Flp pilus assembly protein TadG